MNGRRITVSKVETPERGVFLLRVPDELALAAKAPGEAVATFDYGLDRCRALSVEEYRPEVHGDRIPGFRFERMAGPEDFARDRENAELAAKMAATFVDMAAGSAPGLRASYARLSLGRGRLFLRYAAEGASGRPDLSRTAAELARAFSVQVDARWMGPRDEAAALGGFGPCGRPVCCASWQRRFPAGLNAELARCQGCAGNPAQANGLCGRFKCCLAFENEGTGNR